MTSNRKLLLISMYKLPFKTLGIVVMMTQFHAQCSSLLVTHRQASDL